MTPQKHLIYLITSFTHYMNNFGDVGEAKAIMTDAEIDPFVRKNESNGPHIMVF